MNLIVILAICEMLFINLFIFNCCCSRKYNLGITVVSILVFSAFVIVAVALLITNNVRIGDGRALLFGFIFLIPLFILYEGKLSRQFFIMCMSWIYSATIFVLSVQLCKIWTDGNTFQLWAFGAMTFLYATTFYLFYKLVIPRLIFILKSMEQFGANWIRYFNTGCCLHLFVLFLLNAVFFQENGSLSKVLCLLLVTAITFLSYAMIYRIVGDSIRIYNLEQTCLQDPLTGLGNRVQLFHDLQESISSAPSFSILFMDLDRFKKVNDHYGHMIGDQYLQHFAEICKELFPEPNQIYRFGGDEFVILSTDVVTEKEMDVLKAQINARWKEGAPCPFNQVSVGFISCCPPFPNAELLLQQVDQKMYENKRAKARV